MKKQFLILLLASTIGVIIISCVRKANANNVQLPNKATDTITLKELLLPQLAMQELVYKQTKDTTLKIYYTKPAGAKPGKKYPAVVWIHGGGWTAGTAETFFPHAKYFAFRGTVGISIEYRLVKYGGSSLADCFTDCKSAIRYIREHAAELNIDPDKIIVMGDSAGGHLAAALGTIDGFDDAADNLGFSAKPNAMVLFNPGVDMTLPPHVITVIKNRVVVSKDMNQNLALLTDDDKKMMRSLSPVFNVHPHQPPTLVLHGLDDKVILPEQSIRFADSMKAAGNNCQIILLEKTRHAFVVPKYTASEATVVNAITEADLFLIKLGYLKGQPQLRVSKDGAWQAKK
ncbi:alpha/beta hydrolase [Parasediminibacterium sp. JCM 36343]|uniref:alpha/beta hydrolase n=1 Tax=Parasediminibacterium sp. JCM 36343 TaxID=3374279 RepID=UPI00397E7DD7